MFEDFPGREVIFKAAVDGKRFVILFGAGYCAPCKPMKLEVEKKVMPKYPDISFYYMDVEKSPGEAENYFGVSSLPTLMYVKDAAPTIALDANDLDYLLKKG